MVAIEPQEEAVRRHARAPRADARARPLRGLQGAVADRHRQGSGRGAGARHAVRDAAGRTRQAGGLLARHQQIARRGEAAAQGSRRARGTSRYVFTNRGTPMPYEPLGGVADRPVAADRPQRHAAAWSSRRPITRRCAKANFQVAMDFQCGYIVEPDLDMYKFTSQQPQPGELRLSTTTRCSTSSTTKQSQATNVEERKKIVREFEKRVLDEQAHYLMTLQWHRIIPHSCEVARLDHHAEPLPQQHARHRLAVAMTQPQSPAAAGRPAAGLTSAHGAIHPQAAARHDPDAARGRGADFRPAARHSGRRGGSTLPGRKGSQYVSQDLMNIGARQARPGQAAVAAVHDLDDGAAAPRLRAFDVDRLADHRGDQAALRAVAAARPDGEHRSPPAGDPAGHPRRGEAGHLGGLRGARVLDRRASPRPRSGSAA